MHSICGPAHSTHIQQLLDVGLFGPLSCGYSNELEICVRIGGNVIKFKGAYASTWQYEDMVSAIQLHMGVTEIKCRSKWYDIRY